MFSFMALFLDVYTLCSFVIFFSILSNVFYNILFYSVNVLSSRRGAAGRDAEHCGRDFVFINCR